MWWGLLAVPVSWNTADDHPRPALVCKRRPSLALKVRNQSFCVYKFKNTAKRVEGGKSGDTVVLWVKWPLWCWHPICMPLKSCSCYFLIQLTVQKAVDGHQCLGPWIHVGYAEEASHFNWAQPQPLRPIGEWTSGQKWKISLSLTFWLSKKYINLYIQRYR